MSISFDWLNLAVASGSAFVALCAMITSIIALAMQRKHNRLSVQPIPEITVADYEDSIRLRLRNNGTGPLLIKLISVTDGNITKPKLVSWMPTLNGRAWNHFSTDLVGRSLQPGKFIPLIELTAHEGEQGFNTHRDNCRRVLQNLTVKVEYSDIYQSKFPCYEKKLTWFGRNI